MKKAVMLFITALVFNSAYSQTTTHSGWFFLTHTQKLTSKFDLLADVQLRSADQYKYLNTLLLRGALSYNITKRHSFAAGYVYKGDWMHEEGEPSYTLENRLFEQYIYKFKTGKTEWMVRMRLEQRFIKETDVNFSQRARAFVSVDIPIVADSSFSKGFFIGLQNELFVNVQHKGKVNNHFFDQNRPYGTLGYRVNKHLDAEAGYMYWFQKEMDGDYRNYVFQVTLTTQF